MTKQQPIERLKIMADASPATFPRIGVFIADCRDVEELSAAVERIPRDLRGILASIYVHFELPGERADELDRELAKRPGWEKVTVLRSVRDYGYGGNRKIGLKYAIEQGFDFVAVLPAAEKAGAQELPLLLEAAVFEKAGLVHGASGQVAARGWGVRARDRLANFTLNLDLPDWHSGLRCYAVDALKRVPFDLNSNRRRFDSQLLIQIKSLGEKIREVDLSHVYRAIGGPGVERVESSHPFRSALLYRLHQLHLYRHGRWLVDRGVHYTFKKSPLGSHRQILAAIPENSSVLDLGCSHGLLAHELAKKGCRVVGVDRLPREKVKLPYDQYVQADLDQVTVDLPYGRDFDVVIISDVIEHLKHRRGVMESVRRHLREDGRLILSTGNVAIWFYRISLLIGRFEYGPRGILDETHVRLYTRATFRRLVRQSGFEIVRESFTPLPFELIFETRADSWFIRFLDRCYHALARWSPEVFAYQFIVEARVARLEAGEAPIWPRSKERH